MFVMVIFVRACMRACMHACVRARVCVRGCDTTGYSSATHVNLIIFANIIHDYALCLMCRKSVDLNTSCSLSKLASWYNTLRNAALPVLPGYFFVLVPWASFSAQWHRESGAQGSSEACGMDGAEPSSGTGESSISKVTLHPAPGEMFRLRVTAFDELFSVRQTTLKVRVSRCWCQIVWLDKSREVG